MSNIKKIHLLGIPNYCDVESLACVDLKRYDLNKKSGVIKNSLYLLFNNSLFSRYSYQVRKEFGSALFLYGFWNYRNDHRNNAIHFSDSFNYLSSIVAIEQKKRVKILSFFKSMFFSFVWFFQLFFKRRSISRTLIILPYAHLAMSMKKYVPLFDKKISFFVVYSDLSPDENFWVQFYKHKGIKTMTLQHGIFAKKNNIKTIGDTGIELAESKSDYFLAWNEYTKEQAKKANANYEKFVVLGIPRYINRSFNDYEVFSNDPVFGVILNNSDFEEHNVALIKMANLIAAKKNLKYIIRYHPQLEADKYKYLYGENCLGAANNSEPIDIYAQTVRFSIISSSSLFVDFMVINHPTYRLIVTNEDTYSEIEANSFLTIDDFVDIYGINHNVNVLREYICGPSDVYKKYNSFFEKILKDV